MLKWKIPKNQQPQGLKAKEGSREMGGGVGACMYTHTHTRTGLHPAQTLKSSCEGATPVTRVGREVLLREGHVLLGTLKDTEHTRHRFGEYPL